MLICGLINILGPIQGLPNRKVKLSGTDWLLSGSAGTEAGTKSVTLVANVQELISAWRLMGDILDWILDIWW